MEIKVESVQLPENITFNYVELKKELQAKLDYYKKLVYTADEMQSAKKDKANLNKLKKALNDERVRQEREYMKPFAVFKAQVNELIQMVDDHVRLIDKQVKDYEESMKNKKRNSILAYLKSYTLPYGIESERLFDEKWMTSSKTATAIKKEITQKVETVTADCETLSGLSEYQDIAILTYKQTLDIRTALNAVNAQKEREEQLAKIQAERQSIPEVEEPDTIRPAEETQEEELRTWVSFSALLNRSEAVALNRYLKTRGIEFKKI